MARAAPEARDTLLPRAKASLESGIAQMAAPSVLKVAAEPAQASEPLRSLASSEPIERTEPSPNPPKTWPRASTRTVLRWISSISLTLPDYATLVNLYFSRIEVSQ